MILITGHKRRYHSLMESQSLGSSDLSDRDAYIRDAVSFGEQLINETDRGAALVGLAFLDEMLKRLYEAKMLDGKITRKLLTYPGPLSTAAARADVAYSLGWIGAKTYHDLVTLRKIRNAFAHEHEPLKFTDTGIEVLCARLRLGHATITSSLSDPRQRFMWTAAQLVQRLAFYRRMASVSFPPTDGPPEELENV
jgi:DNA-binding MltR family transcriptional regulator